ncbi:hypothetical protein I6H88_11600 [Elizabethkingia bruuniana]|uniref:Uncharacterized protein n=1 Tax=Elizabethkingia bruuniana TaxID=1756149 RepID=A0A7T7ZWF4_9FLAO|nr:hypothetical protein [Elizabethkingia bruuniana]KGO12074.1 hypothetical protein KS04_00830 [Elizabethkingia miricola]AQX83701.1 hypothetical protein AYC65_01105 [Elizabethkingia bruuniana]KUY22185.1 hypothetical protein ATB97_13090 [Elizabethkingia bruuniana]OPB62396.1 hypothetical protein BAY12_10830 [Elizabethkingia bruuniana]QDZ63546.1 hypothetical protein EVD20_14400 [Elizabethkingia bruuniana]
MKNLKITIAAFILSGSLLITSCRSSDNAVDNSGENLITNGSALIKMNLLGSEYETETISTQASVKNTGVSSVVKEQVSTFMAGEQPVIATLTPITSSVIAPQASVNPIADVIRNPLKGPNVKYRVIAYRTSTGVKVATNVYTIDANGVSTADTGDMMLDGDTEATNKYDFVVLSYNNSTAPGDVTGSISTATLPSISGDNDLMYFRTNNVRVSKGDNVLNVVLTHKFSQITTTIDASAVAPGTPISSIGSGITFDKHRGGAVNSIKLSDGTVTFGAATTTKAVSFTAPTPASAIWTSNPTLLANPGGTAANMSTLTFPNNASGTITVGSKTKGNFSVSNLVVTPGVKYNLKLKFACTTDATPTWPFSMSDSGLGSETRLTRPFNAPAADAGFVFDVYELDNSFNMTINGVDLATQEIQFQDQVVGYPRNIRFKSDGSRWGENGVPQIYALGNSTNTTPIIRITIGPDGSVSMMGRRSLTSNLEPLELYGGTFFNTVTWKTTGSNTVVATMLVTGATVMRGLGVGKKILACP